MFIRHLKALTQFYIDNPHRHDRAQELANDSQSAQSDYKKAHDQVAVALAPVCAKLQPVLTALACVTLADRGKKAPVLRFSSNNMSLRKLTTSI
jgi:hypothetical protein